MQVVSQYSTNQPKPDTVGNFCVSARSRTAGQAPVSFQELEQCLSSADSVQLKIHFQNTLGWALLPFDARRAFQLGKSARDTAYECGDASGLAASLVVVGFAQIELHHLKEAELLLEEARTRFQQLGDSQGSARVLLGLGCHANAAGNHAQAIKNVEKALVIFNRLGEPHNRIFAMTLLAKMYAHLGTRFPEALQLNLQALELTTQHNLLEYQTVVLASLGRQYLEIGDFERARKYLYKGLEIIEGNTSPLISLQKQHARILTELSSVCLAMGRYQKALFYALQGLEIEPAENTSVLRAHIQNNLGELYFHLENLDTAYDHYQQANTLARAAHSSLEEAYALLGMGRVRMAESDLREAQQHFEEALVISESGAFQQIQYKVHLALSDLYKQTGQFPRALAHQEQYHHIKEAVFNTQSDLRLKTLEIVHGVDSARQEAEFHKTQNELLHQEIQDRKRAEAAARQRAEQMEALREIMNDIAAELDLPQLLQKIVQRVVVLLEAEAGELALFDEKHQDLQTLVSFNQNKDYTGLRKSLESGGMGYAAKLRRTIIIEDYAAWEHSDRTFESSRPLAVLFAPLMVWNRLVGVIAVAADKQQRHFGEDDTRLLEMFAQQAAIAIHNAQLFQQIKELAATDPLTGARNLRSLLDRAQEEFTRARRYHHPFSVVMIDIDHFKSINDSYGHAVGDDILRKVSQICRQSIREMDFLGRYSGKEFMILQPETPVHDALITAQRLQSEVAKLKIPCGNGEINVTISVGVAELIDSDRSPAMLIDRVDKAMFRAKNGGRNCVSL